VTGAVAALAVMMLFERKTRRSDAAEGLLASSVEGARPQEKPMRYRTIYGMILRLSVPISLINLAVPMIFFIDNSTVIALLRDDIGYSAAKEALGILTGKAQSLAGIPPILAIALCMSLVPVISSAYAKRDMAEV